MCTYITATLLSETDPAPIKERFLSHGKNLTSLNNPHIEKMIGPARKYYLTTRGGCDCGTVLGSANEDELTAPEVERLAHLTELAERRHERQIERRRKQGWSESKIKRWLAQKERSTRRKRESMDLTQDSDASRLQTWCDLIHSVLEITPELGVLVHSYDGSVSDPFELRGTELYRSSSISPELMESLPYDYLCIFKR